MTLCRGLSENLKKVMVRHSYRAPVGGKKRPDNLVLLRVGNVIPDVHLVEASLQQILKSPAALRRRTKGGWQAVSGLNPWHFLPKSPSDPSLKTLRGQNQGGTGFDIHRITTFYPPTPFKSHLPGA